MVSLRLRMRGIMRMRKRKNPGVRKMVEQRMMINLLRRGRHRRRVTQFRSQRRYRFLDGLDGNGTEGARTGSGERC